MDASETTFWAAARHILHFIGICGAGKTTLSRRLAERCRTHGGLAVGTIDWDPHLPDSERLHERAFRRDLDLALITNPTDEGVHREIVAHSLAVIDDWRRSATNLVVVDRFIESYDHLPTDAVQEIQAAMAASGFQIANVLLVVGGVAANNAGAIQHRILQIKAHRPDAWWATGPESVEDWAEEEAACQTAYRQYCATSRFPTMVLDTTAMAWEVYEQGIVDESMRHASLRLGLGWTASMRKAGPWPMNGPKPHGYEPPGPSWFRTMPAARLPEHKVRKTCEGKAR